MAATSRRLLIVSRELSLLRGHFQEVIAAMAESGVDVRIRYLHEGGLKADAFEHELGGHERSVTLEQLPKARRAPPDRFALRLRQLANLLRFSHPDYEHTGRWVVEQRFAQAPPGPRRWARRVQLLGRHVSLGAVRWACAADRALPPSEWARELIAQERPDVVVAVPVIRTPEFVDVLKAAAEKGASTASWVQSWDNLTAKGLLHFSPDRVFVWNEVQERELLRYHGIPRDRVCITGAQTFDHWFGADSPSDRATFCAESGLDPDQPIILYLASSRQLEPSPATFFERWLSAIRADVATRHASVVARPHPTAIDSWTHLDRDAVAVSPAIAEAPINSDTFRRRFRNELHHATLVVGLNTSAMIDAAIFGKPVCAVELDEFDFLQRSTLHFHYLKTVAGGLLRSDETIDDHLATVRGLITRDPYEVDERSRRFVEAFVRPQGLEIRPADVFAKEMLRLFDSPTQVSSPGSVAGSVGRALAAVSPVLGLPLETEPVRELGRMANRVGLQVRSRLRRRRRLIRKRLQAMLRRARRLVRLFAR